MHILRPYKLDNNVEHLNISSNLRENFLLCSALCLEMQNEHSVDTLLEHLGAGVEEAAVQSWIAICFFSERNLQVQVI